MSTAEILVQAADLIEERGWNQGDYVNDCGGLCTFGALYIAVGLTPAFIRTDEADQRALAALTVVDEAAQALRQHVGRDVGISEWNDAPGRTKAEVVTALRAAAQVAA